MASRRSSEQTRPRSVRSRTARAVHSWVVPFVDPGRVFRAAINLPLFISDYLAYKRLGGAEPIRLLEMQPALHERSLAHEVDAHYFHINAWAARRVLMASPSLHVDIGSQVAMSSILSAALPVVFLDYRPLRVGLPGLHRVAADILRLPFEEDSIQSLSCLHVAEHIGLGRYGDPLDPAGTCKAAKELGRVLAPGGSLLFAVPVGRERVAFNAHRVHAVETVCRYFPSLTLQEFSGVDDFGVFAEDLPLGAFRHSEYACGMFRFTK